MRTFVLKQKPEEEALSLYNRGHYPDSEYDMDDMFYDLSLFNQRRERRQFHRH